MPKNCVKCGGELVGDESGVLRCVSCGWKLNLSALSYGGSVESKNETAMKTVSDEPIFKDCETPLVRRAAIMMNDGDFTGALGHLDRVLDTEPENAYAYTLILLCQCGARSFDELSRSAEDFSETTHFKNAVKYGNDEIRNRLFEAEAERKYLKALALFDSAKNIDKESSVKSKVNRAKKNIGAALELLRELPGYKDSIEVASSLESLMEYYESDEFWYDYAVNGMEKNTPTQYSAAIKILSERPYYKDAERVIVEYEKARAMLSAEASRNKAKQFEKAEEKKTSISLRIFKIGLLFAFIGIAKLVIFGVTDYMSSYIENYRGPVLFYDYLYSLDEIWIAVILAVRATFYCYIFSGLAAMLVGVKNRAALPIPIILALLFIALPGILFSANGAIEGDELLTYYVLSVAAGAIASVSSFIEYKGDRKKLGSIGKYLNFGFEGMKNKHKRDLRFDIVFNVVIALIL